MTFEEDGSTREKTGVIVTCIPPTSYTVTWEDPSHTPGRLSVEIIPAARGVQLVFTHHNVPHARAVDYGAGWHGYLGRLVGYLGGEATTVAGEAELLPSYRASYAAASRSRYRRA